MQNFTCLASLEAGIVYNGNAKRICSEGLNVLLYCDDKLDFNSARLWGHHFQRCCSEHLAASGGI